MVNLTKNNNNQIIINLEPDYLPSEKESYMNAKQIAYFKNKLEKWKADLLSESIGTIHHLQAEHHNEADLSDQASAETDRSLELRARDRERKLINKINAALIRVQEGEYGYCEDTGEPIGLKRLEARPIATLCLVAQEKHELDEKTHREE